jgi:hypothetical protein
MPARPTRSGVIHSEAACQDDECGWKAGQYRNALALAALHHDRTGHEVRIEHCLLVIYGGTATKQEEPRAKAAPTPAG